MAQVSHRLPSPRRSPSAWLIGQRRAEGNSLGNLGIAYRNLGQVEKAIDYHQQALAISQEIGDRRAEGNSLGNLGIAYRNLGQVEKAIDYHQQALAISQEIGDRRGEGASLRQPGERLRETWARWNRPSITTSRR